ncbi:MAG: hypothetical protein IJX36_05570 [Thermoguttaceae bacterium]|nr:hypothetical protein [Thermoguttaceae bacterium]MBQ8363377.1 hypothetical protein [Thermoguttaceae bacterium]MBQ9128416.1 hypothetical protein [Thermoguttaceae bacterium]
MNNENVLEFFDFSSPQRKIDKENGVVSGVKILGVKSRNNRIYPIETLRDAAPLYENAKVNVNHPDGSPNESRKYQDRVGSIKNVTLQENGLYGDFHFNPKHPLAEQMLWDAERAPENFGFSHNVEAVVRLENGAQVVDKIVRVRSVDLVADPATTSGLFESERATQTIASVNADDASAPNAATFAARLQTLESERDAATQRFEIARFLLEKLAAAPDPAVRLALGAPSFLEIALESRDLAAAQRFIDGQLTLVQEAIKLAADRRDASSSQSRFEPIVSKSRADLDESDRKKNFAEAIRR